MTPYAKCALFAAAAASSALAHGEPRQNPWGYAFPRSFDAEIAAPAVHKVRYANDRIMLMEVANPPGYAMQMHGHPYPSIFARSSGSTHLGGGGPGDQYLEPAGGRNGEHWHSAPPPSGTPSLECTAADPQAPHRPVNRGAVPQHFYRLEFKRIDAVAAAPAHRAGTRGREDLLYQDAGIRLFEVTVPPHARNAATPTRYPAVLAIDSIRAFDALDAVVGPGAGRSLPPTGLTMPRCMTVDAGTGLALRNLGDHPLHYYRIEFKRIEGDSLGDHWREWYPAMTTMR